MPYISIKAVLHDLSTMIDPLYWNEDHMHEWAIRGYRKMKMRPALQEDVVILEILEHKALLPSNLRYINQIVYRDDLTSSQLDFIRRELNLEAGNLVTTPPNASLIHMSNPDGIPIKVLNTALGTINSWKPMRASTNTYMKTALFSDISFQLPQVDNQFTTTFNSLSTARLQEYTVDPGNCLTSTLPQGLIMVSFLRYAVDDCGDTLIPDSEDLKDALFHFCMYRYWMSKAIIKEESAERLRDYHLQMYAVLKTKVVGDMNMPTLDEMENLKRLQKRIIPSSNDYSTFFTGLNNIENTTF